MLLEKSIYQVTRDIAVYEHLIITEGAIVRYSDGHFAYNGIWLPIGDDFDPSYSKIVECAEPYFQIRIPRDAEQPIREGYGLRVGGSWAALILARSKRNDIRLDICDELGWRECSPDHYAVVSWISRHERLLKIAQKKTNFKSKQMIEFFHKPDDFVLMVDAYGDLRETDNHSAALALLEYPKLAPRYLFRKDFP